MSKNSYKLIEYSILLTGVIIFAFCFWFYRSSNNARLIVTGLASFFYITWGIVHHALEKRLTPEIALEYILIGFLTFLLVLIALSV